MPISNVLVTAFVLLSVKTYSLTSMPSFLILVQVSPESLSESFSAGVRTSLA